MAVKYRWLAQSLKEIIEHNIRHGIEKLPTEQELCGAYNVSRQTVRQALALLEEENLITRRQGSGSYITGISPYPGKNTVALLISDDQDYLYPALINDIQTELSRNGFRCNTYVTQNRIQTERSLLLELLEAPPRGIIAEGCRSALPNPNLDLYRRLMKQGTSVTFLLSYYPAFSGSLYVKDDNIAGSAMLVRRLADLGHTAIGGIFRSDDLQGIERYQGFTEAMRTLRLDFPDERIAWFDSRDLSALTRKGNTRFLSRIVEDALSSCTAVLCHNDLIAYHLINILRHTGKKLPEELSVVSFDNTYLCSAGSLSVTSLAHEPHEMGLCAARTMIRILKGLPAVSQEVPWKLMERGSTAENPR